MNMSKPAEIATIDGRRQRSERSRAAIITATLTLLDGGNLSPTAKQIAEEAGVGLRSFFRHFEDMDALLHEIDAHLREYYEGFFDRPVSDGTIEERTDDFMLHRAEAYERLKKLMLSTQAQLWRSEAMQENYGRNQSILRKHTEKCLPEIRSLPQDKREAAHAAVSFEVWHRLRHHQKLNLSDARDTVLALLRGLLV